MSDDTKPELFPSLIDRSVKRLFRDQPRALLRLLNVAASETTKVRFEDCNLNFSQLSADHVVILEETDDEGNLVPVAFYIEYQLRPEPEKLPVWTIKWGALCRELKMKVLLLALYLERGDRATFPDEYPHRHGNLETKLSFTAIRLWEHRERIISGEWPELAPLLVLCEAEPTEETLQQEVELIHNSGLPVDTQTDLLGVALLVAMRSFSRTILKTIFGEDLAMLDEMENLKELFLEAGSFKKWMTDPRISGGVRAEAKTETLREMTLSCLSRRFGEVPSSVVEQIQTSDMDWCQRLFDRAVTAASLAELADILALPSK